MGNLQEEIYNFIESKYMDYFLSGKDPSHLNDLLAKARLIRLMQASTNPSLLLKPITELLDDDGVIDQVFIDDSEIIGKIINYRKFEVPNKFIEAAKLSKELIAKEEKVVIWAIFIQNILELQQYFKSIGIRTKVLYGAIPVEQNEPDEDIETREKIIQEFNSSKSSFNVLIANPFAVSESISLHKTCHNAIYLERSFNAAHFIQSKDRIHRYGLKKDDRINDYYLLSNNNIDITVHQR